MSDMDFDELDKAVNALMKDGGLEEKPPVTTDTAPAQQETTVELPAVPESAPPASSAPDQAPASVSAPSVSPVTSPDSPQAGSLATKRRGKFMDVVQSRPLATPTPSVSRQGASIAPTSSVEPEQSTPAPQPDLPDVDMAAVPTAEPQEATGREQASDIPAANTSLDEAAMGAPAAESVETPTEESAETTANTETQLSEEGSNSEPPLSSPFLPDAKVEKRPLGAPAATAESAEGNAAGEPVSEESPQPQTVVAPELHPDLTSLENESTAPADAPATTPAAETESSEAASATDSSAPATAPAQSDIPAGGAIPQQYQEKPPTGDQASGSIFDTADYHQPLQHPEKKKSGLAVILWIMVLGLVGAIGAAAYFFLTMH